MTAKGLLMCLFVFLWAVTGRSAGHGLSKRQWQQWEKLLYLPSNSSFRSDYKSEFLPGPFFLHPMGHKNPQAELKKMLEALQNLPIDDQHVRCRFPARYTFLQRSLSLEPIPEDCPKLKEFKKAKMAKAAAIVFSSYYLNAPASVFGHTLLRLIKKGGGGNELLDFAINYSADTVHENAFIYTLKGLTGGYQGSFKAIPYYYKIREYNDFESRDLWSYELNFNESEMNFLLNHLWELGSASANYFYLSHNCSYFMLKVVEVIKPHLNLAESLPFYTIPADTLRILVHPKNDLVRKIHFRPSLASKIKHSKSTLNSKQVDDAKKVLTNIDHSVDIASMNLAINLFDFENIKDLLKEEPKVIKKRHRLLLKRSRLGKERKKENSESFSPSAPHKGHDSARIKLGWGDESRKEDYYSFQLRGAFHSFFDFAEGYPANTELELVKVDLRYYTKSKRVDLQELVLVNARVVPTELGEMGWQYYLGLSNLDELSCQNCKKVKMVTAVGLGESLWDGVYIYSMIGVNPEVSHRFQGKFRINLFPSIGIQFQKIKNINFQLEYLKYFSFLGKTKDFYNLKSNLSIQVTNNLSLFSSYERKSNAQFWQIGAAVYF